MAHSFLTNFHRVMCSMPCSMTLRAAQGLPSRSLETLVLVRVAEWRMWHRSPEIWQSNWSWVSARVKRSICFDIVRYRRHQRRCSQSVSDALEDRCAERGTWRHHHSFTAWPGIFAVTIRGGPTRWPERRTGNGQACRDGARGCAADNLEQRVAGPSVMTTIRNSFLLLVFHPESKAL